jgi:hypothetical protein
MGSSIWRLMGYLAVFKAGALVIISSLHLYPPISRLFTVLSTSGFTPPSITSLLLLSNISTCEFVFRARRRHRDVVDPGVLWYLLPVKSDEQTEFKKHEDLCQLVRDFEKKPNEYIENESIRNKEEWQERLNGFEMTAKVIGRRKMDLLPFYHSYYELPGWISSVEMIDGMVIGEQSLSLDI